jgi:hypothetical protein
MKKEHRLWIQRIANVITFYLSKGDEYKYKSDNADIDGDNELLNDFG